MKALTSIVKGHEGKCKPTFLNRNSVDLRTTTRITGCFKNVKKGFLGIACKHGKEFHGYIGSDWIVRSTEGIYNSSQFI